MSMIRKQFIYFLVNISQSNNFKKDTAPLASSRIPKYLFCKNKQLLGILEFPKGKKYLRTMTIIKKLISIRFLQLQKYL